MGIDPADAMDYSVGAVGAAMTAHADKLTRRRQGDRTGYTAEERSAAAGDDEISH